jgi:hypothetical protein
MKTRIITLNLVLLAVFAFHSTAVAQEARSWSWQRPQFNASARLSNGIRVAFAVQTEPPGAMQFASSYIETEEGEGIHRVFIDKESGLFIGYDVKVEPVPNSRQIKVSIMPMSADYESRLRGRATFRRLGVNPDFKSPSLFQTQAAQLLNDGDMLAIDALVNQKTGVKIVEIIKASFEEIPLGGVSAKPEAGPARDFSLDDVEMKMINYRLLVNGELVAGHGPTGGCSGSVIWFYLPERGRFIFSIRPHEGYDFQRAGQIENNKISFSVGGEQYEWISSSPVLGISGRFNLWMLRDPDYRPDLDEQVASLARGSARLSDPGQGAKDGARPGLLMGAADKIEYLLPKR